ncbi:hypothetical protein [Paenibacillus graminis]|uniref:hypothetical protein n=1 Tax=Paenibacillus graminis TaxID=189425 RepID=UPI0012DEABD4|nr:hypothetical protein [Paenibacillus graminis]
MNFRVRRLDCSLEATSFQLISNGISALLPGKLTCGASTTAFLPLFPGKPPFGASTTAFLPLFPGKPPFGASTTAFLPLFPGTPAFSFSTTAFLPLFPGTPPLGRFNNGISAVVSGHTATGALNNGISAVVSSPHSSFRQIKQKDSHPLHTLSTTENTIKASCFWLLLCFRRTSRWSMILVYSVGNAVPPAMTAYAPEGETVL